MGPTLLSFSKIILSPVLISQGKKVKRDTPVLPEPSGDRIGTCGEGKKLRLLLLGDSAAAGVGAESMEASLLGQIIHHLEKHFELHYKMIARTGASTASTLRKLAKVEDEVFDVVVTSLGVNDVTRNTSISSFLRQQEELGEVLRSRFGARQIVVSGYPPVGRFPALPNPLQWYLGKQSEYFDRRLKDLCNRNGSIYVTPGIGEMDVSYMASDGFHPGPKAYAMWGRRVAEAILGGRDLL